MLPDPRRCLALAMVLLPWASGLADEFRLTRIDDSVWEARWCFDQPIEELRFERSFPGMREQTWMVIEKTLVLTEVEGQGRVVSEDKAPFRCASMRLSDWFDLPEKNYYAMAPFSDGGRSVYTGYLLPSLKIEGEWQQRDDLPATYKGREGERVITREPQRLARQFVYFGPGEAAVGGRITAVVDPAMPALARRNIIDTLPVINEFLHHHFDFEASNPWQLFMATDLDAFDGYSVKGGTQKDQILFTLKGREVVSRLEENPTHYAKTAAHEVLHLWQGEVFLDSLGTDHPWMHEGSADALAFEIMRESGIWDEETYEAAWSATEAACLNGLGQTSVHEAPNAGRFDLVYSCGALLNRLAGETIDPARPGRGILAIWRVMAAAEPDQRQSADEDLYFSSLQWLGVNQDQQVLLREFLDTTGAGQDWAEELGQLRANLNAAAGPVASAGTGP